MGEPVKAPLLRGPIAYQGYVSDARVGNNVVLGSQTVLYTPVTLTEEPEDHLTILQVAWLLSATPRSKMPGSEVAHRMLCGFSVFDRIRAMNPKTNPWRSRIYNVARDMIEARLKQLPRDRAKKVLAENMSKFLPLAFARKS
jgi:hypothetical protein